MSHCTKEHHSVTNIIQKSQCTAQCCEMYISCNYPVPVAAWSKVWVCGRLPAEIVGSNLAGGMNISLLCYMLPGGDLCDWLITRPEEFYQLWCVTVCDL
jgi:hypothetical protein